MLQWAFRRDGREFGVLLSKETADNHSLFLNVVVLSGFCSYQGLALSSVEHETHMRHTGRLQMGGND